MYLHYDGPWVPDRRSRSERRSRSPHPNVAAKVDDLEQRVIALERTINALQTEQTWWTWWCENWGKWLQTKVAGRSVPRWPRAKPSDCSYGRLWLRRMRRPSQSRRFVVRLQALQLRPLRPVFRRLRAHRGGGGRRDHRRYRRAGQSVPRWPQAVQVVPSATEGAECTKCDGCPRS